MNTEYYYPHTGDRQMRERWEEDGRLDMWARARQKAREILQTHQPEPLPPEIEAAIRHQFEIVLPSELAGV
jgi:trimethylamine--corrinoid protein Co-methyltransferase